VHIDKALLILQADVVSGQLHCYSERNKPQCPVFWKWMGLRGSLDGMKKRNIYAPIRKSMLVVHD
jgi:hypothetical protein